MSKFLYHFDKCHFVLNMDMKVIFLMLLIYKVEGSISFSFSSKISGMVSKAKDLYKKKFHKDKLWHFLGYDPTEYPSTDEKYLRLNREKWKDYYECLHQQEKDLEKHGSLIPEAVLALEGHLVMLECKTCLSPAQQDGSELAQWYWSAETGTGGLLPVELTEHTLTSPDDNTLRLYNVGRTQTGQYICLLKGSQPTAPYFLTVQSEGDEPLEEVGPGREAQPNPMWAVGPLLLYTMWTTFTPCSRCNAVGKRHRIGYCTLTAIYNINQTEITGKNGETELNEKVIQKELERQFTTEDVDLIRVFKLGVPCRSHVVPHQMAQLTAIHNRPSELYTGLCRESCPTAQIFEVRDSQGHILESANNSAGLYSMLQGPPPSHPAPVHDTQYEETDTVITITCPGNLNMDTPIQWYIGSKKVIASLLFQESIGRIYQTMLEKIVITNARVADSDVYSCWQQGKLAGAVRLIVETSFHLDLNHHIILFGIVIIILTFSYVFIRAFRRRKNTDFI